MPHFVSPRGFRTSLKTRKGKLDHDGRAAHDDGLVGREAELLDVVRHEADVAVPVRLLAVDGQMDVDAVLLTPDVLDLGIVDQIVLGAGAVDNVDLAVAAAVVAAVVDDRVQRGQADAAR